jgi:hypothetical protein
MKEILFPNAPLVWQPPGGWPVAFSGRHINAAEIVYSHAIEQGATSVAATEIALKTAYTILFPHLTYSAGSIIKPSIVAKNRPLVSISPTTVVLPLGSINR